MDIGFWVDDEPLALGVLSIFQCTTQLFFSTVWKPLGKVISDCVPSRDLPSLWSCLGFSSGGWGLSALATACTPLPLDGLLSQPLPLALPVPHSFVFPGAVLICGYLRCPWEVF